MPVNMETMVQQSCNFVGTPRLNLEGWAALLRSTCGGGHKVIDPNAFAVWIGRLKVTDRGSRDQDPMRACGRGSWRQHLPIRADAPRSENGAQWLFDLSAAPIGQFAFGIRAAGLLVRAGDFNGGRMLSVSLRS
jgi:hypothetical protein